MGPGKYELKFKVDVKKELFQLAALAREASAILKANNNDLVEKIIKLKQDKEKLVKHIRELSKEAANDVNEEKINNIIFKWKIFDNLEKKQLQNKIGELCKENCVVVFLNKVNGNTQVMITTALDLKIKAPELLEVIKKYNGKGGGRDNFAMGGVEEKFAEKVLEDIKNKLKKSG